MYQERRKKAARFGQIARRSILGLPLAAVFAVNLAGCAVITGYNRDWNETLRSSCGNDLSGCWEGEWRSCVTGHHGPLRAIITRQCGNVYTAHFHARFLAVIPFQYSVPLTAIEEQGVYHFRGQADLGRLAGGTYRTHGQAGCADFHANYCSKKDRGEFILTRHIPCD